MISEVVISTVRRKSILIKDWLDAFLSIFFPRCCLVCGGVLAKGEECLCARWGGDTRRILHSLKYGGQKEIGEIMGRHLAVELLSSGFFEGIDMLVPVPLHKKKEKLRGYNQSEWIARGVSVITLIPVFTSGMVREKNTETQTHKSAFERWENVDGIFRVTIPEYFSGKHILIIDDVLTTGATIVACASAFDKVEDIRISILTLAVAE